MWPVLMGEAPAYSGPRTPDGRVSRFVVFPIGKAWWGLLKDTHPPFVSIVTLSSLLCDGNSSQLSDPVTYKCLISCGSVEGTQRSRGGRNRSSHSAGKNESRDVTQLAQGSSRQEVRSSLELERGFKSNPECSNW